MRICQKWSITQIESKPASSAVRAMSASVLPSLAGPAGQVKSAMSSPSFMAPQRRISVNAMKPILCIRNDRDDPLGITAGALAEAAVPLVRLDAFEPSARWPALEEIGGLIVFGGEMNVDETEQHPYLLTQRDLMRRAGGARVAGVGICLGAPMLAPAPHAQGFPAPVREVRFQTVRLPPAGQGGNGVE